MAEIAEEIGVSEKGMEVKTKLQQEMESAPVLSEKHRILFVYARGAGSVMVGGKGTSAHAMIEIAGGVNAGSNLEGFKPLTGEAVLLANPDVILLFDSGLESLEGPTGLLSLPGVASSPPGLNERFVTMDGQLLLGFGPRLPEALEELVGKINAVFE